MPKIFKPRYPTANAGFWFSAISLALSYGLGALLVIGLMNNNQSQASGNFNLGGALLVFAAAGLLLAASLAVIYRLMQNRPKQVILEQDRLLVQDVSTRPPRLEADIPFNALTLVRVADVPVEGGFFPASFEGLFFRWEIPPVEVEANPPSPVGEAGPAVQAPAAVHEYTLSSRHVRRFEELRELVFDRTPEAARGAKSYRL